MADFDKIVHNILKESADHKRRHHVYADDTEAKRMRCMVLEMDNKYMVARQILADGIVSIDAVKRDGPDRNKLVNVGLNFCPNCVRIAAELLRDAASILDDLAKVGEQ